MDSLKETLANMEYELGKNGVRKLAKKIDLSTFNSGDESVRRNIISQVILGHDYDETAWNKFLHPYDDEFAQLCAEINKLV